MTRSWLARTGLAAVCLAAVASGATAATSPPRKLPVSPRSGRPLTTFTVRFTAPQPSGVSGVRQTSYELSAAPARPGSHGCISAVSMHPSAARAGQTVSVRLDPRRLGGHWCRGTYRGAVYETSGPYCPPPGRGSPAIPCPEFVTMLARLGTFAFTIRH